ncbi:MAG: hypothetical protein SGILL_001934, partial [Bacillariaceae sp.]
MSRWQCVLNTVLAIALVASCQAFPMAGRGAGFKALPCSSSAPSTMLLSMASDDESSNYDVVKVDLSDGRDYPIYIGTSYSDEQAETMLASHVDGNKALIITNDRIAPMYLEKYSTLLARGGKDVSTLVLPDGEEYKNMEILQ